MLKSKKERLLYFLSLNLFSEKILERHVAILNQRILNKLQQTTSKRYDLFAEQYPAIEQYKILQQYS